MAMIKIAAEHRVHVFCEKRHGEGRPQDFKLLVLAAGRVNVSPNAYRNLRPWRVKFISRTLVRQLAAPRIPIINGLIPEALSFDLADFSEIGIRVQNEATCFRPEHYLF